MPLTPEPHEGFTDAAAELAKIALLGVWKDYVSDCQEADTAPDVDDFAVWMIRVLAFRDGLAFAGDDADEPGPEAT